MEGLSKQKKVGVSKGGIVDSGHHDFQLHLHVLRVNKSCKFFPTQLGDAMKNLDFHHGVIIFFLDLSEGRCQSFAFHGCFKFDAG